MSISSNDTRTTAQVNPNPTFNVEKIRNEFPILSRCVYDKPLVYLDNAASTQKPRVVIDAIRDYYESYNANIHRGIHALSEEATAAYEKSRKTMARFVNANSPQEIVFTRGTTESINLVANTWGAANLKAGDEILITWLEHHSNIVPWQMICEKTGAILRVAPINDPGEVIMEEFEKRLSPRTKIVSVAHISNSLGTLNPVKKMTELAHAAGAVILIDGAQASMHLPIDVQDIGCDFYALSGHKMFGPTGIGILWSREAILDSMPPWQGGGEMITSVTFDGTTYNEIPHKFEAGTPHIEGGIVIGVAAEFIMALDQKAMAIHESDLLAYATDRIGGLDGVTIYGTSPNKAGVISFALEGMHPYDIAPVLDRQGIAIRTGHHCAQPVMDRFDVPATIRASLALYNTRSEIDALVDAIEKARTFF